MEVGWRTDSGRAVKACSTPTIGEQRLA